LAKKSEIQEKEVRSGAFELRTKQEHDRHVAEVLHDVSLVKQYGVKGSCVLSERLEHFHTVGGFPPDLMHDLMEGVIPTEMSLCINDLVSRKLISLESLNQTIKQFPYKFSDKVDQPQIIPGTFEGKHKVFKQVIRDTKNFKNVTQTLAVRHQRLVAYHIDSPSFLKPPIETNKVMGTLMSTFPQNIQEFLRHKYAVQNTVLAASSVSIDGIKYNPDMVVSVGNCSGLPDFKQIFKILVIKSDVLFVCKDLTCWYIEHLRSFELCSHVLSLSITKPSDLNDPFPLPAYTIRGRTYVTLKHYITC